MRRRKWTSDSGNQSPAAAALLVLVSCVASCRASTSAHAPPPASPQAANTASGAATTASCPSQDFGTFLTAFANDAGMQEAFTRRPLHSDSIDVAAEPEPKPVSRMLDGAELRFPLMPSQQRQEQEGLKMRWTLNGNDKAEVLLAKEDTDYRTAYFFIRNDCWRLYRIRDDSL